MTVELEDDSQLLRLARHADRDLFPILDRAEDMAPLIVLLAIVPALVALAWQCITPLDAAWGLRVLDWADAGVPFGAQLDSFAVSRSGGLDMLPPLGTWLGWLVFQYVEPRSLIHVYLPSYLAVAVLVIAGYLILRELSGARVGLLAGILSAFHAPVLVAAQDASPLTWGVSLGLLACWGSVAHFRSCRDVASLRLLAAGLGLGLCLLAGGVMAIVVYGTVCVYAIGRILLGTSVRSGHRDSISRTRQLVAAVGSLVLLALTALAVGAWWEAVMFSASPDTFGLYWLLERVPLGLEACEGSFLPDNGVAPSMIAQATFLLQALIGLSLLGFWRVCRGAFFERAGTSTNAVVNDAEPATVRPVVPVESSRDQPDMRIGGQRDGRLFLAIWFATATLLWIVAARWEGMFQPWRDVWARYFLVAAIGLAACGFDDMARRKVSVRGAILVVAGSLLAILLEREYRLQAGATSARIQAWGVTSGIVLTLTLGWLMAHICRGREALGRYLVTVCLVLLVIVNASLGLDLARGRSLASAAPENATSVDLSSIESGGWFYGVSRHSIRLQAFARLVDHIQGSPDMQTSIVVAGPAEALPLAFAVRQSASAKSCHIVKDVPSAVRLLRTISVRHSAVSRKPVLTALMVVTGRDPVVDRISESISELEPVVVRLGGPVFFDRGWVVVYSVSIDSG